MARMRIAHSLKTGLIVVTGDGSFPAYGVTTRRTPHVRSLECQT